MSDAAGRPSRPSGGAPGRHVRHRDGANPSRRGQRDGAGHRARPGHRPRRRRRAVVWACALTLLSLVAAGLYLAIASWHTLGVARAELDTAKADIDQVRSSGTGALETHAGRMHAASLLAAATASAGDAAAALRASAALGVVGDLPLLDRQRQGALDLATDAATAAETGRALVLQLDHLAQRHGLVGGRVPLGALGTLQRATAEAAHTLGSMVRSAGGLWGPLGATRARFDDLANQASRQLRQAADTLGAARTFFAESGTRTYLVVGDNNAEMRDEGTTLSYSVVTFDHGHYETAPAHFIQDVAVSQPVDVPGSQDTQSAFAELQPTLLWQSVNATVDFPWSGTTMAAMYHAATGGTIDGVIAIDIPALASLLQLTGPVSVPGIPGEVTGANVTTLLGHDLYATLPAAGTEQSVRHEEVAAIADAVLAKLRNGSSIDLVKLGKVLADAVSGRHLLVWSAHAGEERAFVVSGIGGDPVTDLADRTFHVAVENATATKLDYYVHPSVACNVFITPLGYAVVTTAVTVANDAPVGAPPSYQLGPDGINSHVPGEYVGRVLIWGPAGSEQLGSVPESGLRLNEIDVDVLAGQSKTVRLQTVIPYAVSGSTLQLRFVPQPRFAPVPLTVDVEEPGRHVSGNAATTHLTLGATTVLTWTFTH